MIATNNLGLINASAFSVIIVKLKEIFLRKIIQLVDHVCNNQDITFQNNLKFVSCDKNLFNCYQNKCGQFIFGLILWGFGWAFHRYIDNLLILLLTID